jgi:hypothetical protein
MIKKLFALIIASFIFASVSYAQEQVQPNTLEWHAITTETSASGFMGKPR